MKTRHVVMSMGLIVSAGLALFGDKQPNGAVTIEARPARVDQSVTTTPHAHSIVTTNGSVLPLRARLDARAHGKDPLRDTLFQAQSWTSAQPATAAAEPPPQAPPLPLTYLGVLEDDKHQIDKVLLANGEKTHIVGINDVIDEQYKVISITRQTIVLEYVPLGQQQTLSIQ